MPTEVVVLLADLSLERAVCLALMLCGLPASLTLLALSDAPLLPERVRTSAAYELTALRVFQVRDRAHLVLVAAGLLVLQGCDRSRDLLVKWLLAAARRIAPKGAGR